MARKRKFVVIGLDVFGETIAMELSQLGNHVLGIGTGADENRLDDLADTLAEAVIADPRDEEALREAGVENYDVAVVAIENFEAKILCTMNLKLLGVDTIWAKADNRIQHRILSRIGADRVIHPEQEIGEHVAQMLHNPLIRDYVSLGNGYYVVDFKVPEKLGGQAIEDLELEQRFDLRCLGLMRGTRFIQQNGGPAELHEDDMLLLLGRRNDLRKFGDSI
ncbi:MAG: TrkA family potassium uptake protein [Wenzhouxiangellaceae bacterium]|nr:TrkA family potassium uptake protein [Wenzhouxiangellaceae bacterium]